jgi:hypothetical protein
LPVKKDGTMAIAPAAPGQMTARGISPLPTERKEIRISRTLRLTAAFGNFSPMPPPQMRPQTARSGLEARRAAVSVARCALSYI